MNNANKKCFSLSRNKIIKNSNEIRSLLNGGEKISGRTINIFFRESTAERFAVLISRRVGNAVKRNRMKRMVREIYRTNPDWFSKQEVLFLIKKLHPNYASLEREIFQLVMRR